MISGQISRNAATTRHASRTVVISSPGKFFGCHGLPVTNVSAAATGRPSWYTSTVRYYLYGDLLSWVGSQLDGQVVRTIPIKKYAEGVGICHWKKSDYTCFSSRFVYSVSLQLRDISHELELTETVMALIDLCISRKTVSNLQRVNARTWQKPRTFI